jgi:hypothetical protein
MRCSAHKVANKNVHTKVLLGSVLSRSPDRGEGCPVWWSGLCRHTGINCLRRRDLRGTYWMRALTQYLADLPGRENGEKAGDARPGCEHGQFVCVELGNLRDWHVRLAGQGFDGSLVRGAFVRMRGRGKPVHVSLASCGPELPGWKSGSMPLEPGMIGRYQPFKKPLEPAVCFRPHTPFPCPFIQPYPATPRTRSHRGARGRRVL